MISISCFKAAALKITNEELEVDDLCFQWLKAAAKEYGKEGQLAIKLLDIVKEIINA